MSDVKLLNYGPMSSAHLKGHKFICVAPIGVRPIGDEIRVIMLHFLWRSLAQKLTISWSKIGLNPELVP